MRTLEEIRQASAAGEEITDKELVLLLSVELAEAKEKNARLTHLLTCVRNLPNFAEYYGTLLYESIDAAIGSSATVSQVKPSKASDSDWHWDNFRPEEDAALSHPTPMEGKP